jgi:Domain of unknown function (DUF3806)
MSSDAAGLQRIERPNDAEHAWLEQNLRMAADLAQRYTGVPHGLPSLVSLGATFARWGAAPAEDREDANLVVNALGIALGQHLVNEVGLHWAVVSDESGTDLAVHGEVGEILVFPTSATAKRCESGDYEFFQWFFDQLCQDIGHIRGEA